MSATAWEPEAEPQSHEEVHRSPLCPEVVTDARRRGITSIVHFTHIKGLVGILASSAVKARKDLPNDEMVKYVYEANAADRSLDEPWHNYTNLSVTDINPYMFQYSKHNHPSNRWVILEFSEEILGDRGVVFCTTNNIYPAVRRSRGLEGFSQMFAPKVPGRYENLSTRERREPHQPTDPQAEVLYPYSLSLDHLHTVTACDNEIYDAAVAALANFPQNPRINIDPEAFR